MKKTLCFLVLSAVLAPAAGWAQEAEGIIVNWDVLEAIGAETPMADKRDISDDEREASSVSEDREFPSRKKAVSVKSKIPEKKEGDFSNSSYLSRGENGRRPDLPVKENGRFLEKDASRTAAGQVSSNRQNVSLSPDQSVHSSGKKGNLLNTENAGASSKGKPKEGVAVSEQYPEKAARIPENKGVGRNGDKSEAKAGAVLKKAPQMQAYPAGEVTERKINPLSGEETVMRQEENVVGTEGVLMTGEEVSLQTQGKGALEKRDEFSAADAFLEGDSSKKSSLVEQGTAGKEDLCEGVEGCLGVMLFESESSDILPSAEIELEKVFALMQKQEEMNLRLQAHAAGTEESRNHARRLSLSRALAVRSWLVDRGIRSTRIEVRPVGHKEGGLYPDRVELIRFER